MAESPGPSRSQARPVRKFAVEPVESTHKSSRGRKEEEDKAKPRRRFAPQLEETSSRHVRKGERQTAHTDALHSASNAEAEAEASTSKPSARKTRFAPQLIETTKRSKRKGDTLPAMKHTDKTDLSPGDAVHLPRHMRLLRPALPIPPLNSPSGSTNEVPRESRFSSSYLAKQVPRRTSFRTPDLAPINSQPESDDSNGSNVPSLSTTPSAASDDQDNHKHLSRTRESCDDRFSGYLLALAARVAEKQLQEQAMAAYPNENRHEPVDHFAVDRDSGNSSDDEVHFSLMTPHGNTASDITTRRESAAGWEAAEMRRHKEDLEYRRKKHEEDEAKAAAALMQTGNHNGAVHAHGSPFSNPYAAAALPKIDLKGGGPMGSVSELKQMRSAASPPMLGGDLIFPACPSPKATHIDATQKPQCRPRGGNVVDGAISPDERSGLWTPIACTSPVATRKNSAFAGLWNGVCTGPSNDELCPPGPNGTRLLQSGLMTPGLEVEDQLSKTMLTSSEGIRKLQQIANAQAASTGSTSGVGSSGSGTNPLPSPIPSPTKHAFGIDEVIALESRLDCEFTNAFVTQIYNYLSLGYPALAHKFDHELSKISGVGVAEIRRDDERKNTKGYVALPEGDGVRDEEAAHRGFCARWRALRLYVREWGRQEGRMKGEAEVSVSERWGQTARRGSWAI